MQTVLAMNSLPVIFSNFLTALGIVFLFVVFAFWIGILTIIDDAGHPLIAFILLILTFVIPYSLLG